MTYRLPTPQQATRQLGAALLVGLSMAGVSYASQNEPNPRVNIGPANGDAVKVYGCKAEDDCTIDYRGSRRGGVWVITREAH